MKTQINRCCCEVCLDQKYHPDKILHQKINRIMSVLNPKQRRWFAALEAIRMGRGGISRISLITGLDRKTIRRGIDELEAEAG